ncbi:hypothetical protein SAMN05518672_106196 [Chitinophaga sp. CF118]|nr:hypothetical protein SAMN05518672_106196 [Chitinophaga sp. CF118]
MYKYIVSFLFVIGHVEPSHANDGVKADSTIQLPDKYLSQVQHKTQASPVKLRMGYSF